MSTTAELVVERKDQPNETTVFSSGSSRVLAAPIIDESYWAYRVRLSDKQAVVAFPKYGGHGCGFQVEEDWNTNLPIPFCSATEVYDHIKRNKGDRSISDETCIEAIELLRQALIEDGFDRGNRSSDPI